MVRWLVLAALGALAVACGAQTPARPVSNRAAAQADAAVLLGRLSLPPGATSSPAAPAGALARPASRQATPNLVDLPGFWKVAGRPEAVLAYVGAHPPAGSHRVLSGAGVAGFAWPPRRGVLGTRWLVVEAVALPDASTGVRADAEVVWVTGRPARERIPDGTTRLRVGRSVVTSRARIRHVVRLLDALPVAQPGAVNCPADIGHPIRLAFYRSREPLAVAVADPGGCRDVALTVRGRRQPTLAGGPALIRRLEHALGLRLNTTRRGPAGG